MSTRSYICVELTTEDQIKFNTEMPYLGVYCHHDGYVDGGVGDTLQESYNSYFKALRLIKHGEMSSLDNTIKETTFYNKKKEDIEKSYFFFDKKDIADKETFCMISYLYIFTKGRWLYKKLGGSNPFRSIEKNIFTHRRNIVSLANL